MTGFDLIVRGGRVVTPQGVLSADIGVRAGRIAEVGTLAGGAETVIDATGCIVLPGGVDVHCHIEQRSGMGRMNADTFETATRSALIGGTTTTISFAAQEKGERLSDRVADYAARARAGAMTDHAFHLTVTDPSVPGFADDLNGLIAAGHRSIKLFTTYNIALADRQILDVMAVARAAGALVCVHAENDALIGWTRDALLSRGLTRPVHHAVSHPRLAEIEAVERMIRFAEFLGTPVMLFHISTAEAAGAIRAARARGVPVRAETCPHYLFMTSEVLDRPGIEGAKWMCSPPQRTEADQAALWAALGDATLDLVSSDHAPYRFDASGKLSDGPDAPFPAIANGLPGLETRMPLMFDALAPTGDAGLLDLARLTADLPARIYGLPTKGRIAAGMDADLVLWDPDRQTTWADDDLHDNVGYNPWAGRRLRGWPVTVLRRGKVVVEDGTLRSGPGEGRWLPRDAIGIATAPPSAEVALLEATP